LKIAQVAPLYESVPPQYYGGTERVVSYLTDELVELGHDVTLFASGDSMTRAELRPMSPRSLRLDESCIDQTAHHVLMMEKVFQEIASFDVAHFHIDYLAFPLIRRMRIPSLTTLHGRLDIPDLQPLYREFREVPLVSISDAQREPLPWVNWLATVHHGIPESHYRLHERPGEYLAFLGRVSPEKRVDRAIEIARKAKLPLRIAAKVDDADREYHESVIAPLIDDGPSVEFLGEVTEQDKRDFLGNAKALLFPIDWPEPFGMVMIEAMACGTPVIAYARGSVPEVLEESVTGFLVSDIDSAVSAVDRLPLLSRRRVREEFDRRFTARRMAEDYLRLYERIRQGGPRAGVQPLRRKTA
jgi:glycosyltransferase involved in cell wall biosynthesis